MINKTAINHLEENEFIFGTFIATFIIKNKIFLFSDGRIVNTKKEIASNTFSKIHKLTTQVGMLTAGRYLPNLVHNIINRCDENGIVLAPDVVKEVSLALSEEWEQYLNNPKNKNCIKDVRVFTFVCGFDSLKNPRLFYLDNMTTPSFNIQEKLLFQGHSEVEFGALTTNQNKSDSTNSTLMMKQYIKNAPKMTYKELFYKAFTTVKDELSKNSISIGGVTFMAEIDIFTGFSFIESK